VLFVAAVAVAGMFVTWPGQLLLRDEPGPENLRAVAQLLGANSRRGDAVVYVPSSIRLAGVVYPDGVRGLRDVAVLETGAASGTLIGVDRAPAAIRAALLAEQQVWVVYSTMSPGAPALLQQAVVGSSRPVHRRLLRSGRPESRPPGPSLRSLGTQVGPRHRSRQDFGRDGSPRAAA
jgi:hypothetical protein